MRDGLYVEAEIRIYEIDGDEVEMGGNRTLTLQSHSNERDKVVLSMVDGKKITVASSRLLKAIEVCTK
ncbi:MAG: hypothetical protein AAGD43_16350 [Pseudomonadota bacterium]